MTRNLLAAGLLLLGLSAVRSQTDEARLARARATWESLSPQRRELILANYRRFQAMPEAQRSLLRRRYEAFAKLSRKEREELLGKWRRFSALPEGRREELRRAASEKARRAHEGPRERSGGRERGERSFHEHHEHHERHEPHGSGHHR
ncbi:MAG TPA: DUF3106 domain-containing protein [Elusimicrobiota bacterium]|jgi:hypothetical protein|nr:DUF3106 domain-containing protein [Elusimicrobiota bacterium]